jgi:hypothetical protein
MDIWYFPKTRWNLYEYKSPVFLKGAQGLLLNKLSKVTSDYTNKDGERAFFLLAAHHLLLETKKKSRIGT